MASNSLEIDDIWPNLELQFQAITAVATESRTILTPGEYMAIFDKIFEFCKSSKPTVGQFAGGELYYKMQSFLSSLVGQIILKLGDSSGLELINKYRTEFELFSFYLSVFNPLFKYLNNNWVKKEHARNHDTPIFEIASLGLYLWREQLLIPMRERLAPTLFIIIENERKGEQVDMMLLKFFLSHLTSLELRDVIKEYSLYISFFEVEYLHLTELYYTKESSEFLSSNTISDYIRKVNDRFNEEHARAHFYLHYSTLPKLIDSLQNSLILTHSKLLLDEASSFLKSDSPKRIEDLGILYNLIGRVKLLNDLATIFETTVIEVGNVSLSKLIPDNNNSNSSSNNANAAAANNSGNNNANAAASSSSSSSSSAAPPVKNAQLAVEFFNETIKVYLNFEEVLKKAFNYDDQFMRAYERALRKFTNENAINKVNSSGVSQTATLLADYCHAILRKGAKEVNEDEMNQTFENIMKIYHYLEEKDVFHKAYQKRLSMRLIFGTFANIDYEKQMVAPHLKEKAGRGVTLTLERMFVDMENSSALSETFKQHQDSTKLPISSVSFTILSTGSWLIESVKGIKVPPILQDVEKIFERFYSNRHSGRKLSWEHKLSKGELDSKRFASSKGKSYNFLCSGFQISILWQYNSSQTTYSKEELLNLTTGEGEKYSKHFDLAVMPMIQQKLLLFKCENYKKGSSLPLHATFTINEKFASKTVKVSLNKVEESVEDRNKEKAEIKGDRNMAIQAIIVRTMKMRRELIHNDLVSAVFEQTKCFTPTVSDIKRNIDNLIEKEYLERDKSKKDLYHYLA